ncbi:MAG TPA: hypothetical protein VGN20_19485 [Mucilaginibacter sp.]|jgi:hypothetical protein
MQKVRFTKLLFFFFMALLVAISSCQKDPDLKDNSMEKANLNTDSIKISTITTSSGNYLATAGILTVKFKDSTYVFDASRDSIAFVNVQTDDTDRYFGITAINKEHTLSFGVSSAGFVSSNTIRTIAGSQLLLKPDENKSGLQYSLSRYTGQKDFGNINIIQYNQGNELAKGTFVTFLAKDDKANTPFYKIEGSFDLHLK